MVCISFDGECESLSVLYILGVLNYQQSGGPLWPVSCCMYMLCGGPFGLKSELIIDHVMGLPGDGTFVYFRVK